MSTQIQIILLRHFFLIVFIWGLVDAGDDSLVNTREHASFRLHTSPGGITLNLYTQYVFMSFQYQ